MGNKRVSQLTELVAQDVNSDDLFLIIDTSVNESKKITALSLSEYLNASGSLDAIHATIADTASYVLGSGVDGTVRSSSFSVNSANAYTASFIQNAVSASHSQTASWAANAGGAVLVTGATYPITSSWSENSTTADFADTATNLLYIAGVTTNTASYSIKAKTADNVNTSSFSIKAESSDTSITATIANTSILSNATNFLNFSPNNGTASYALTAGSINSSIKDYGIYLATSQSLSTSQLGDVFVNPSVATGIITLIDVVGTIVVPFTSSIIINEVLNLVIKDRNSGIETIIDSTPIYYNLSPIMGNWDTFASGTIKMPYSMMGSMNLFGHYLIFATASSNVYIEPNRINRFNISSLSDNLGVSSGLPLEFYVSPPSSLISFSSSLGGPFIDIASNIVGSGSNNIFDINCNGLGLTNVKYLWSLPSLATASFATNSFLSDIEGFPNSLEYLDCGGCIIQNLSDLSSTMVSYLKCDSNFLLSLPSLPATMSYINCSNNFISNLPIQLPYSLSYFYCDGTNINSVFSLPNTIISMSFANNPHITFWSSPLPSNLVYINVNNSPITSLTTLSPNLKYIFASNCSLTLIAMDNICSQSLVNAVNNAVYTGSIDITGNGSPNVSTINDYIVPLIGTYKWSISFD